MGGDGRSKKAKPQADNENRQKKPPSVEHTTEAIRPATSPPNANLVATTPPPPSSRRPSHLRDGSPASEDKRPIKTAQRGGKKSRGISHVC